MQIEISSDRFKDEEASVFLGGVGHDSVFVVCMDVQAKKNPALCSVGFLIGSSTWARTRDLRINSPALYRLSYRGIIGMVLLY